jgi:hypothetical protein
MEAASSFERAGRFVSGMRKKKGKTKPSQKRRARLPTLTPKIMA